MGLPLVWYQLSIVVGKAVVEIEQGVGKQGARVVGPALLGGAVGIEGRLGSAVVVDVRRVCAVVGEFAVVGHLSIVDHLTGNRCGASGQGKEGKDEELHDGCHVGKE